MRPLIYAGKRFSSRFSSHGSNKSPRISGLSDSKRPFEQLQDSTKPVTHVNQSSTASVIAAAAERANTSDSDEYPLHGIKVKRDLEWNEV